MRITYSQVARRVILALVASSAIYWLVVWFAVAPTYTSYSLAAIHTYYGRPPVGLANRIQQWKGVGLSDTFLLRLVRQDRLYPNTSELSAVAKLRHAIFIHKVDFPSDDRTGVIHLQIGVNYPDTSSGKTTVQHVANRVFWSIFQVDAAYMNRLYPLPATCRHADCDNGEILLLDSAGPGKRRS